MTRGDRFVWERILGVFSLTGVALLILLSGGAPLRPDAGVDPVRRLDVIPVPCGEHVATIVGTEGPDLLWGTPGPDVIAGRGGDDSLFAGEGDDIVCGGSGMDRVFGEGGRDVLYGQSGDDTLSGGAGDDRLFGGGGDDRCVDADEVCN